MTSSQIFVGKTPILDGRTSQIPWSSLIEIQTHAEPIIFSSISKSNVAWNIHQHPSSIDDPSYKPPTLKVLDISCKFLPPLPFGTSPKFQGTKSRAALARSSARRSCAFGDWSTSGVLSWWETQLAHGSWALENPWIFRVSLLRIKWLVVSTLWSRIITWNLWIILNTPLVIKHDQTWLENGPQK